MVAIQTVSVPPRGSKLPVLCHLLHNRKCKIRTCVATRKKQSDGLEVRRRAALPLKLKVSSEATGVLVPLRFRRC